MYERFTERARKAIIVASNAAERDNSPTVTPMHVLLACAKCGGAGEMLLARLGVSSHMIEARLPKFDQPSSEMPEFAADAKRLLEMSLREALQLGHNYVGTEHLILCYINCKFDWPGTTQIDVTVARRTFGQLLEELEPQPVPTAEPAPDVTLTLKAAQIGELVAWFNDRWKGGPPKTAPSQNVIALMRKLGDSVR